MFLCATFGFGDTRSYDFLADITFNIIMWILHLSFSLYRVSKMFMYLCVKADVCLYYVGKYRYKTGVINLVI